jgi:hypothetical protein
VSWFEGGSVRTSAHTEMFDSLEVKFLKDLQLFNEGKYSTSGASNLKFDYVWDGNTTQLEMWVTVEFGRPWALGVAYHGTPETGW